MINLVDASMPGPSEQKVLHVRPGDTIDFKEIVLEKTYVDIIGPDVILTNSETKAKIIFPGLGLILFSAEEAPQMLVNGEVITPAELLSKIGRVHNITTEDYLSFTSIDLDEGASDGEQSLEEGEIIIQEELAMVLVRGQPQKDTTDPETAREELEEIEALLDYRSTVHDDAFGTPYLLPLKVSLDKSSSQQRPEDVDPNLNNLARTVFDFDTRMLQLASVNPAAGADVHGGGGSELAAFDPGANPQYFGQETIDKSGDNSGLVIYADNPDFFDNAHGARNIQISPNLPDDFDVTEVKLTIQNIVGTVTPSDFSVFGVLDDGTGFNEIAATFNPATGTFTIPAASIQLDGRGDINLVLVYDQALAGDTFEILIESTAEFDFLSGGPVPENPIQTETLTRTVKFTNDYASEGGGFDWYLETTPNDTRIFSGSGDDTIFGGMGRDFIETNGGDDTVYADSGDGGGDDEIDGGEGGETTGDTVIYTGRLEAISVDLGAGGAVADGSGFYDVTVGIAGETDKVKNIENISGGSGDDTIVGDNDAFGNILSGGGGDDLLMGGIGNDTLTGGSGTDTLSYAYLTGAGAGITIDLSAASVNAGAGDADTIGDLFEHLTATSRDDAIIGNTLDNDIDGGGGTDTVSYAGRAGTGGLTVNFSVLDIDGMSVLTFGSIAEQDRLIRIENLTGTGQGDTVTGDAANNIYLGLAGNDTISGAGGDDTISGGADDDTLNGDAGDDSISGGAGIDAIDGGTNTAIGDTVDYSAESGVLDVNLTTGIVAQDGAGSADTVTNIENVRGGSGTNTIRGSAADNVMTGGASTDNFFGSLGSDTYTGNGGSNILDYSELSSGNIDVRWNGSTNTVNKGAGGTDSFSGVQNINGSILATDTLTLLVTGLTVQSSGAYFSPDALATLIGVENVEGSTGADTIHAMNTGTIDNTINGNGGNDIIYGGDGNHTLDGGLGTDTLRFGTASAITFNLTASTAAFATYTNNFSGFEEYYLGSGDDTVTGSAGNDGLVRGENGNDTFLVSAGADSFDGGGGTDTYDFNGAAGAINVNMTLGSNQVIDDGFGNTETITSIENISGTNLADTITGNTVANTLLGRDGNDILSGAAGNDTISGGNDNDTISGGADNDTLNGDAGDDTISGGAGVDVIDGGANTATGDTVDYSAESGAVTVNLTTGVVSADGTGSADTVSNIENVRGGSATNTITGNASNNVITGGASTDNFFGSLGNDTYTGNAGSNTLNYSSLSSGNIDVQWDGVGNTIIKSAGGTDSFTGVQTINGTALTTDRLTLLTTGLTVQVSGAYFSPDALATLIGVERVEGSAGSDAIFSMSGAGVNNTINGNAGDDIIYGGNGTHTLNGGSGGETLGDQLVFTTASNMTFNLSTSTAVFGGFTNTFAAFERYQLGNGTNTITGSAAADGLVRGGTGSDTFNASTGADQFDGDGGTDTYNFASTTNGVTVNLLLGSNQVTNDGYGNIETISNVENITGSGFVDNITGSAVANTLIGNNGNDTLNGDAGNDNIQGGNGDDIIDGGADNDTIDGGANNDTIAGGSGDDSIVGGTGNDTIDGGTNTAVGAASGGDTANYSAATTLVTVDLQTVGVNATGTTIGNDTLTNIENVSGGTGNDVIRGDGNSNRFVGNNGNDSLNGRGGNDFLFGSAGDDTLIGGAGNDTLDGGTNFDTVDYSTAAGAITVNLVTGAVSNDGDGGADTLVAIESIIGTTGNDTVSSAHNNYTLSGGTGTDTLNYAFTTGGITANLSGLGAIITGTINKTNGAAVTTDSVTNFESFVGGSGNDIFTFNTDAMIDGSPLLGTVNGGTGTDRLNINNSLSGNNLSANNISGTTIAGIFSNIDELNLTGATVNGNYDGADYTLSNDADDFDLTQANVEALVGVGGTLALTVSSTFDLFISGATNAGGGVYQWGATTVNVTAV